MRDRERQCCVALSIPPRINRHSPSPSSKHQHRHIMHSSGQPTAAATTANDRRYRSPPSSSSITSWLVVASTRLLISQYIIATTIVAATPAEVLFPTHTMPARTQTTTTTNTANAHWNHFLQNGRESRRNREPVSVNYRGQRK